MLSLVVLGLQVELTGLLDVEFSTVHALPDFSSLTSLSALVVKYGSLASGRCHSFDHDVPIFASELISSDESAAVSVDLHRVVDSMLTEVQRSCKTSSVATACGGSDFVLGGFCDLGSEQRFVVRRVSSLVVGRLSSDFRCCFSRCL